MRSPSDRLYNLLLARSASSMSVATTYLLIADPCSEMANDIAPIPWSDEGRLRDVEAETCALAHYSGVSWDAMAARYEISRQSLHRRMADTADKSFDSAQKSAIINRRDLNDALSFAHSQIAHLKEYHESELIRGVSIWKARRYRNRWWDVPGHNQVDWGS